MIEFKNVSKRYAEGDALSNLNLTIPDGKFVCIIGKSGSGKTTLLRLINKMIKPTDGSILIDGVDISDIGDNQLRRQIGYVIQSIGLFPTMNIRENILIVPRLLKWSKTKQAGIAEALLARVDLPKEILDRKPKELSGGQQQRIGVVRALAANQKIILMDEPFGALDPITRSTMQDMIKRIQQDLNKTVIFVTHDMAEARRLSDYLLIMNNGKVEQFGTAGSVVNHPANEFVKELVGIRKQSDTTPEDVANPIKVLSNDEYMQEGQHYSEEFGPSNVVVIVDNNSQPIGFLEKQRISENEDKKPSRKINIQSEFSVVNNTDDFAEVTEKIILSPEKMFIIIDGDGKPVGTINREKVANIIRARDE